MSIMEMSTSLVNPMDDVGSDYHVVHTNFCPVHIIGHGRSGTSIFGALCRKYLGIGIGTESQFIVRYSQSLPAYGDLREDRNVRRLINDITRERYFERCRKFGFQVRSDAIFGDLKERTYRGVLDATFTQLASHLGMQRYGDKTPEYVFHLPLLGNIFPDAQFIHIVRDGRDVALSAIKSPLSGIKNIPKAAWDWEQCVGRVRAFTQTLPRTQFCEIRYEDLLSDPRAVFQQLIEFLGIAESENSLLNFITENVVGDLRSSNFGKWRKEMTQAQRRQYEQLAGDMLRTFGYPTEFNRLETPGTFSKFRWEIDNRIRQWMYPEYWEDNLYKARIRARALIRRS